MITASFKPIRGSGSPSHRHIKKTIQGSPKTLHLPQICKVKGDISSVLIVRQESPWNKYRPAFLCDIAGEVIIATNRSNPSRLQAVRQYPKADAERLIQRFGYLDHVNILSSRDCYIDSNSIYVFVDDFPLTMSNIVSSPGIYPTDTELAAIMSQVRLIGSKFSDSLTKKVLDGLCYLRRFGLSYRSFSCQKILLGTDGRVKIACLDQCTELSPMESHRIYFKAIPSVLMALMQKHEKDGGITGVEDLDRWPVDSDAFAFLAAASTETIDSLKMVKPSVSDISHSLDMTEAFQHPLITARFQSTEDLVMLARHALCAGVATSRCYVAPQR
ncbi:uncharacterized protein N7511_000852 [Penicillium nucicola]|uniref:uncharacterized protein n=1 Tax=Penicillium nucicola TaxID=1850975 RepID=UPI002544DC05|nr:uncharacterized protein N7511_000852 [Penicillium nucicola]KAJ5775841.1 hypothetical protein N7511_000852 [Penicillium nucicola]